MYYIFPLYPSEETKETEIKSDSQKHEARLHDRTNNEIIGLLSD